MDRLIQKELENHYVLFSTEGGAESVVIEKLVGWELLAVPNEYIVRDRIYFKPYTRLRKAKKIADEFLNQAYITPEADQLLIARIVDSDTAKFELPKIYKGTAIVKSFITSPEIEMLIIHNEGAFQAWEKWNRQTKLKPSEFCIQEFGMNDVKRPEFLDEYWNAPESLVEAICKYAEKAPTPNKSGFYTLRDLLC